MFVKGVLYASILAVWYSISQKITGYVATTALCRAEQSARP